MRRQCRFWAAVEEGVLPGGGVALLRGIKALAKLKVHNDDQRTGIEIVKKALSWPARQIAINAGEDGSIVVGKILEKDAYAFAYDAQTGSMATWSRRASSTRQKSYGSPCRARPRSRAC
jgi:chaperonin GroEL (HSP60 family)